LFKMSCALNLRVVNLLISQVDDHIVTHLNLMLLTIKHYVLIGIRMHYGVNKKSLDIQ